MLTLKSMRSLVAASVVSSIFLAQESYAILRFGCSQLVTQRFDPLVTPGQVAPHVHQIIGGNSYAFFNLTMDPSLDLPTLSTCTTCRFKEDLSNYWTAVMYFKHDNGSFVRVPQIANHYIGGPQGGMTIYYIQPPGTGAEGKVTSFPKGFRMIVGDPMLRTRQAHQKLAPHEPLDLTSPEAYALSFRCWETGDFFGPDNSFAPGAGPYDTVGLPPKRCPKGIRANIYFPSCWDGVNLDMPDHHSHVAFQLGKVDPSRSIFFFNGTCPSTHPVRIPMLFYETYWDTEIFKDVWPTDGRQPLVLSMGDPTGFGQHGDYIFGWEGDSLQRAMDNCHDGFGWPEACPELTILSDEEINKCVQQPRVDEVVEGGYIKELPGCNPVQEGPATATMVPGCTAISTTAVVGPTPGVIKHDACDSVDDCIN
ncbi:hypothetical protein DFP72DRAFT_1108047 [Ephemerocybe angulata]|uniref:DUF1996 domain-containing protein n=1 Tax=Ephemerocybe angulata TaxID=980116 RepID=A0A8H6MDJ9_9AGAR|nr:hypothetical protein DFP72DRAFT_1108047 [Tulosesus angulatus]